LLKSDEIIFIKIYTNDYNHYYLIIFGNSFDAFLIYETTTLGIPKFADMYISRVAGAI
jgi:hypothetical protein